MRHSLIPAAAASFLSGFAEAGVLVIVTFVATNFVESGGDVELWGLTLPANVALLAAAGLLGAKTAALYYANYRNAKAAALVQVGLRTRLLSGYLDADWRTKSARRSGDLQELASTFSSRTSRLVTSIAGLLSGALSLLAFLVASLVVSPLTTVAIIAVGAVVLFALRPISLSARRYVAQEAALNRSYSGEVNETSQLGRDIDTFNVSGPVLDELDDLAGRVGEAFRRARIRQGMLPHYYQSVMLALALGGLAILVGTTAPGSLATVGAVVLLMLRSLSAGQQVVTRAQQVHERAVYLTTLHEAIGQLEAGRRLDGSVSPDRIGPIEFRDVEFRYPGEDRPALQLTHLRLDSGESLGVVGRSGAGKSTLVQLLLRLREPTSGEVTVSGVPMTDTSRAWWSQQVAFVPQEPLLLTGTVAENVAFHRSVGEDRIRDALRRAHLIDEIEEYPDGIHTRLGADGGGLSGGQRQRLAFARALVGNPSMIVLDEPTSALDPISERLISETLSELKGQVTLVIVAHRRETLGSCDQVLVLANGQVADLDSTADLASRSGYFAEAFGDNIATAEGTGAVDNTEDHPTVHSP